ncbi:MAG: hypothetical protein ACHQ3P_06545 [Candidatus Limnocylindrales bacterium]
MRIDRRFLGWGVFLVALGGVPLLVQVGALDASTVAQLWRFWPILLIAGGLGILLSRTSLAGLGGVLAAGTFGLMLGGLLAAGSGGIGDLGCVSSGGGSAFPSAHGDLTDPEARVDLTVNCGTLHATTASGTTWSLSGTSGSGASPTIEADGSHLAIQSPHGTIFDFGSSPADWTLSLPQAPTTRLGLTMNAGTASIDMSGAALSSLGLTANAGSMRIDLSGARSTGSLGATVNAGDVRVGLPAQSTTGSVTVNAGSFGFCVPDGTAVRVQTSGVLGGNNFADHGLTQSGATWTTPGYDTATVRLDLQATVNAGSLELNPQGGCR